MIEVIFIFVLLAHLLVFMYCANLTWKELQKIQQAMQENMQRLSSVPKPEPIIIREYIPQTKIPRMPKSGKSRGGWTPERREKTMQTRAKKKAEILQPPTS